MTQRPPWITPDFTEIPVPADSPVTDEMVKAAADIINADVHVWLPNHSVEDATIRAALEAAVALYEPPPVEPPVDPDYDVPVTDKPGHGPPDKPPGKPPE